MNHDINNASQCFAAYINNVAVGFIAVIHFPHPKSKNIKKIHRLVVLPDYQGVGIGIRLLEFVAKLLKKNAFRCLITTSTPALMHALNKNKDWKLNRFGRVSNTKTNIVDLSKTSSAKRITTTYEYVPQSNIN